MFKSSLAEIRPYRVATPPHRIKLNQNENPVELPAALRRKVLARMREVDWSRYPPFPADTLQRRLARKVRLPQKSLLLGHGSNELVLSAGLATLRARSRVVIPTPSFAVFTRVAKICEATITEIPLTRDLRYPVARVAREAARPSTRLVYLASPNNPTGAVLSPDEIEHIARGTKALIVLDEAYQEFAAGSLRPLLDRLPNLVIIRTFSKAFALASIRLGWAMGAPDVIARLEAATLPFSIDRFAQIAAEEVLDHSEIVTKSVRSIRSERTRLQRELARMEGVHVYPSEANFILARFADGKRVWEELARRGILVRDVSAHAALANCLRITVGTVRENEALRRALRDILS
jgi:histidinol-phosphate aminotransferase